MEMVLFLIVLLVVGLYLQTDNSIIEVIASCAVICIGICLILSIPSLSDKMRSENKIVEEYQIQSLDCDDWSKRNDSDFVIGYGSKISHGKTITYYVVRVKQKSGNYTVKKYRASKVTLSFDAKDNDSASIKMKYDGFNKPIGDSYIKLPQNTIQEKVDLAEY